jgi:hypothetical protein
MANIPSPALVYRALVLVNLEDQLFKNPFHKHKSLFRAKFMSPQGKSFMIEIRFLVLQETRRPPSGGKTTPLGGWHGHLLVTPALHGAVQKVNKLVGILEVREILWLNISKPEKSVKEILEISPIFMSFPFYTGQ